MRTVNIFSVFSFSPRERRKIPFIFSGIDGRRGRCPRRALYFPDALPFGGVGPLLSMPKTTNLQVQRGRGQTRSRCRRAEVRGSPPVLVEAFRNERPTGAASAAGPSPAVSTHRYLSYTPTAARQNRERQQQSVRHTIASSHLPTPVANGECKHLCGSRVNRQAGWTRGAALDGGGDIESRECALSTAG